MNFLQENYGSMDQPRAPPKSPAFVLSAFQYLSPRIDLMNWGQWHADGPRHTLSNSLLLRWLNNAPLPEHLRIKLASTHVHSHLAGTDKFYFKAHPSNQEVLLGLDLDHHGTGPSDAEAVAQWVDREWLPAPSLLMPSSGRR